MDQELVASIKDDEHLRLLVIFNWIMGILTILFTLFMMVYFFFMGMVFNNPEMFRNLPNSGEMQQLPPEVGHIFIAVGVVFTVLGLLTGIATILSAVFMKKRKYRLFSIITACIHCLNVPFGTILGIFSIVVLMRDTVVEKYRKVKFGEPPVIQA